MRPHATMGHYDRCYYIAIKRKEPDGKSQRNVPRREIWGDLFFWTASPLVQAQRLVFLARRKMLFSWKP